MRCGHTVSASFIFLCHSEVWWGSFPVLLSPQASPPKSKSGSYCTIAFYQAVSCWLCTIAETVGLSPAATPGAPFIPVGKDAMTPWIFGSFSHHNHYSTINPIMLQDFAAGLWFRRLQKRVRKISFFHIVSKILRHRLSTCKKSVSSLLAVKDTCLFLTYAGEILLLPLPTILDTYLRFLTTPGGIEGKTPFLHPV